MATITALKAQKRNPERINVYLDGTFAFGLARIVAAWLRIGQELSEEKIEQLRAKDTLEKGVQAALTLLSYRPRAEAEIGARLKEKGYSAEDIAVILTRLRETGLTGDAQFARVWAENRADLRPRGRRLIRAELRSKGVAENEIEQALATIPDESEMALVAARKAARKLRDLDWETFRNKLSGHLARKGFSFDTISPILRQVWQELQES